MYLRVKIAAMCCWYAKGCEPMDLMERMLELSQQGYYCAQILLILALESEGRENPELVRAMGGLNGGMGNSGGLCGCMSGGACFLSYFTGKGEADEIAHPESDKIIQEFVLWFKDYTAEYGGTDCRCILEGDTRNKIQRCPIIMEAVLEKCMSLLEEHDCL